MLSALDKQLECGTIRSQQFPVLKSVRAGLRLARIAGPVFGKALAGVDLEAIARGEVQDAGSLGLQNLNLNETIPRVLDRLAETLDPEEFASLAVEILSGSELTTKEGNKILLSSEAAINAAFGADVGSLFGALRAALEVNNFFGFGAITKLRLAMGPKNKKSPAA